MSARWRQVAGVAAFMAVAAQFAAQAAASQTDATEVSATSSHTLHCGTGLPPR
jgi:hypothetical protein